MFCTQCGARNADNATVCNQCGRPLSPAAAGVMQGTVQPGTVARPMVDVPNYLVFAILTTVLCCLPAGIPAIIYSAQVNGKLQAGDIAGAQSASKNAKMWCFIALGLGLAVSLIYGLMIAAGVMARLHR